MCPCFRLLLPKGTLFSEEGPEIRSVVVADVRAMEGWLPDNVELAGGGLACVGPGEDGATYLASSLLDPSAKAQQPEHTDFRAPLGLGCRWGAGHLCADGAAVHPCPPGAALSAPAGERR
jgi:hypothetical protein